MRSSAVMKKVQTLGRRRLWPAWIAVATLLVLTVGLGSYGFWEPQEMQVADRAVDGAAPTRAKSLQGPRANVARGLAGFETFLTEEGRSVLELKKQIDKGVGAFSFMISEVDRPPLNDLLVKAGVSIFGVSEFGARLPFVVLAVLTVLATFALGVRIRGERAGLWAVLILLACPLFLFQARQIESELAGMLGGLAMALGAVGLLGERTAGERSACPLWLVIGDGLLILGGAAMAHFAVGFFLGVFAPLSALALASTGTLFWGDPIEGPDDRKRARITAAVAWGLCLVAGLYIVFRAFVLVDAGEDDFSIFGKTLVVLDGYQPLLGGVWQPEGNTKINFDGLFEHVAFGMFPWVCLAPFAVARMAMGGGQGTRSLGARVVFGWALAAWVVASILLRKVGPVQYTAVPAVALAIGVWLDELSAERENSSADSPTLAPPLLALFVLLALGVVAKDIKSFPEIFLSVHLDQAISKFPEGVSLHKFVMALGMAMALCLAVAIGLWLPRRDDASSVYGVARQFGRYGLPAAFGLSILCTFLFAQVWIPRMSTKLSSRDTFSVYHTLRDDGDLLGVMGKQGAGPRFYARGDFENLRTRNDLIAFLKKPDRVFALVKASELCPVHKESSRQGFDYYVIDDSNAEMVLLSNKMWSGAAPPPARLHQAMRGALDENPLSRSIVRERPSAMQIPLTARFEDQLELIGVDMPREISRGTVFEMTLYFRVLKPLSRNWKVFVHFDGSGVRFQGDHDPVNNRCGTTFWQPGDYIIDRFEVEAGNSMTYPEGSYRVWAGLFQGSAGNWTNMKVTAGQPDDNNRVPIGSMLLK